MMPYHPKSLCTIMAILVVWSISLTAIAGKKGPVIQVRLTDEGRTLVIQEKRPERKWKARLGGAEWSLKRKKNGKFVIRWGEQVVAKGWLRNRRLKLKDPYGYEYAKIKFKRGKIKVYTISSYSYDLKPKDKGWKVSWGSMKLGTVVEKKGFWVALDTSGQEKARCSNSAPPLTLSPFLMTGMERTRQVVLALLFFALKSHSYGP